MNCIQVSKLIHIANNCDKGTNVKPFMLTLKAGFIHEQFYKS